MNKREINIDGQYDEIDLKKVVLNLWNEKVLIVCISLSFLILTYFYASLKPVKFQTVITLKEFPNTLISKYNEIFPEKEFIKTLNREFTENLNSFDNIENFIKQNQNIDSFKKFLKKKKISGKEYFLNSSSREKFGIKSNKRGIIKDKYYLNFPEELNGQKFLNDYAMYTYKNAEIAIKDKIKSSMVQKISIYEKNLLKAKKLNIQYPVILERLKDRNLIVINNPQEMLIYNGTILLGEEIEFYRKLLNDLNEFETKFNPILDSASSPQVVSTSPKKHAILGLFFGLLLSFIIIIIKNTFKNE